LSENAFNGDAQFTVSLDGTQIGGPTSVTTLHGSGFQDFVFTGDFGGGPHTVEVDFVNDAWGGTPSTDRNLYVGGITFDGANYAGQTAQNTAMGNGADVDPNAAEMYTNGAVTFTNVIAASGGGGSDIVGTDGPDRLVGTDGNDTIEGLGGNDTIDGGRGDDVIFTGDGQDLVIMTQGISGSDTVHFTVGAGGDVMELRNYGYTSFADVQSHMTALTGGGTLLHNPDGSSILFLNEGSQSIRDITPANFTADNFVLSGVAGPPPTGDTLVLHLSEDAFDGDAQFRMFVDGTLVAPPTAVTTLHGSGFEDFTYTGAFGAGPHTVEIQFINDAWGGTPSTDRNLYVGGITFDGVDYPGQTAANTAMGGGPDVDPNAAEMFTNGSVTFSNVTSTGGGGGGGVTHIVGTDGNDSIAGTAANEFIEGLGGDDTITSGGGNDTLSGGPGNDFLFGGSGNVVMLGGDGGDGIFTGSGNDTIDGGPGEDFIRMSGNSGNHIVTGGDGTDLFEYHAADSGVGNATTTITDFATGQGGELLQFFDLYTEAQFGAYGFDAFYNHMTDGGGNTVLHNTDGSTITFDGHSRDDFTIDNFAAASTGHPPPGPDPIATLVLHLSEDAFNGDAKFRLLIDGHQMSGALAVTASHSAGASQDFTFTGRFGTNPHTVEVQFVNDAYGGTPSTDRNLYVGGVDYNGVHFSGQTATNTAMDGGADVDPNAAEMYTNGSVIFHNVTDAIA
jgi:Ca2+-binding RTX toxin-like protein